MKKDISDQISDIRKQEFEKRNSKNEIRETNKVPRRDDCATIPPLRTAKGAVLRSG